MWSALQFSPHSHLWKCADAACISPQISEWAWRIFFSGELPKTFNIRYLLLQIKAVRGWSHMQVALSQQCTWNSCPKWSVRHNPYLGILWPYRRFEFLTSFNALNFSTGSHNRIWSLIFHPMLDAGIQSYESEVLWLPCHMRKKGWHL